MYPSCYRSKHINLAYKNVLAITTVFSSPRARENISRLEVQKLWHNISDKIVQECTNIQR